MTANQFTVIIQYAQGLNGLVRDVFPHRCNMRSLQWAMQGIGQVPLSNRWSSSSAEEAQPFYVNAPFGITLAHNGNLTNC